jgi:WhiB family transcriptional regulator, redox-sensing transcriptional regulator
MNVIEVKTACQKNPDMWFSEDKDDIKKAKAFCGVCPVKEMCLKQAEESKEVHGIWGGKNFQSSIYRSSNKVRGLCRNGLHDRPKDGGQCKECRAKSQAEYNKRKNERRRGNRKPGSGGKPSHKKNAIGDFCHNGHYLTINNTKVRTYDGALMCTQCYKRVQPSIRKTRREADTWRF